MGANAEIFTSTKVQILTFFFSAILRTMGANAEIFPLAKSFLLIRSISAPAELWYSIYWLYWSKSTYTDAEGAARLLVAKGASYGHQNTKAPLIAITVGSAAHLVLDYLFIIHLNFSGNLRSPTIVTEGLRHSYTRIL